MDAWESAYQQYRQHVQQSLLKTTSVVISPDNDDLPPEEGHIPAVIGSYEIGDK